MLKLKNWKTPWGLNDFVVPVCYALCLKIPVQSVPSSKSQTLAPQCLLPRQLRPSKGVQSSCSEVAHDLKLNNGKKCWDRFSIPKWWKHFLCPKRPWPVCQQPLCCWRVLLDVKIDLQFQISTVRRKVLGLGSKKRSNEIRQHSICIHLLTESRNATGPLEQYHNERTPAAPETKTFQGWNGYGKIFHVLTINKQRQESS